jgi:hypothetical protein
VFSVLVADLTFPLLEGEPSLRQKRFDHVLSDTLCLFLTSGSHLAVDIDPDMMPVKNLLAQLPIDEFFPEQQGEGLQCRYFSTTS